LNITLQSVQVVDSIFQLDWPILNNSIKKGLFIIMQRALIPIEISTAYILTLNLDSFVSVSKKKLFETYNTLSYNFIVSHFIIFRFNTNYSLNKFVEFCKFT